MYLASRLARYKGRIYRLAFLGETKYGWRAKLQTMDGSEFFWVDSDKVHDISQEPEKRRHTIRLR